MIRRGGPTKPTNIEGIQYLHIPQEYWNNRSFRFPKLRMGVSHQLIFKQILQLIMKRCTLYSRAKGEKLETI